MVRHLVFWTLKPEADGRNAAENAELFKSKSAVLLGRVPGLLSLEVSTSIVDATEAVDVVLMSTHESVEAYKVYADHPDHLPIKAWAGEVSTGRRAVDYEI